MDARPLVSAEQQGGPSAKNAGKRRAAGRATHGGKQQRRADPPQTRHNTSGQQAPNTHTTLPRRCRTNETDHPKGATPASLQFLSTYTTRLQQAGREWTVDKQAAGKQQARQRSHEDQVRGGNDDRK
ncbi:Hypothetical predicted protein [Pelobates cultripes]|uniref:Uncharacterized protein n=1 Tax=Pelobates cultripes TaxID=61616 RepID=A0AAD1W9P3_PELCU|nr:Hypothetical predicted protein [Pelobates cultripes]